MELQTRSRIISISLYPVIYWAVHGTLVTPWAFASNVSPASTARGLLLAGILLLISRSYGHLAHYEARRKQNNCGVIPKAPLKDPFLGLDFLFESLAAMKDNRLLYLYKERFDVYGSTYNINLLGSTMLLTNEPENLKAILSKKFDDWPIGGPRLESVLPVLGRKSIFSSNGEDWHEARALIRPSFARNQVDDFACFDRHISSFVARIPADGQVFDAKELLQLMSMDVSTDFLLGCSTNGLTNLSPEAAQFLEDFDSSSTASSERARLGILLTLFPHPKIDAASRRMREFIAFYLRKAVSERKSGASKERQQLFLDVMLESGASEGYLVDQILSVILAGRDTTASTFTCCFWFLGHHPEVLKKLCAEISTVEHHNPSWEELKNLKYMNNVIKETLRLASPISTNSRKAARDTILPVGGGPDGKQPILVLQGTAVRWSSWSMHRSKETYGEDADEFRPERWDGERLRGLTWEYTPFSGGPRICVGQQFALTQLMYTLFRIFQQFKNLETHDDGQFRFRPALASTMPNCMISMTRA